MTEILYLSLAARAWLRERWLMNVRGIPGLDESYLPRYIGYGFGALLVLNHFLGSDSSSITPAQLRTEALGLSLASFSAVVPYLGKFLKGATPTTQKNIPEGVEQIFVMSLDIAADLKKDLAWGTYVLLRNTNSISVKVNASFILTESSLQMVKHFSLVALVKCVNNSDSELKEMVPVGTRSLLVQPIREACELSSSQTGMRKGFILLASGIDYAFTDKDKAWIASIANKFSENVECVP
ncbi:protein COFACTOR ASSEMBLY OF COMPLEX C SUBUNIT B CCB2, chloroplastic-like [Salvia miltiorrhiza]|uniref:protein COFACTOR ASSEMBLY OF COMPLEX C SUBUNIT B CCB2, chloroplastic-like n=1 Tax=Salvia miltiorrhiza TaxID=226208 RepID=UPI0025AB8617|nr:protein COFACTOR ASSEMBLY OF COMPLEX C SUBUNIT B CCB2, chloroplastic-like [Salvia miltiorrhiza]